MQFSLRTILLSVTLIACYLGAWRSAWHARYTKPIVWSYRTYEGWRYTAVSLPLECGSEGYPWIWKWPSFDRLGYTNVRIANYSHTSEKEGWAWLESQEARPFLIDAKQTAARWSATK